MKNIRNFYKQYNNPQSTVGQGVRYYVNKHLGNIIFQPPPFSDFLNKSVKYETQPCHILDVDTVLQKRYFVFIAPDTDVFRDKFHHARLDIIKIIGKKFSENRCLRYIKCVFKLYGIDKYRVDV
jgi:hypothetical protein